MILELSTFLNGSHLAKNTVFMARQSVRILAAICFLISFAGPINAQVSKPTGLFPIETTGQAKAWQEVEILPQVGGIVVETNARLGQKLSRGDILIKIDQAPFKIKVDHAKVRLKNAQFVLRTIDDEIERLGELIEKKLTTLRGVYELKLAHDHANGVVEEAEAQLKEAELQLSHTIIKSPIDGYVSGVGIDVGDYVFPGGGGRYSNGLMSIVKLDPIRVVIGLDQSRDIRIYQRQLAGGKLELDYMLQLPTGQRYPHPGKLRGAYYRINPTSGLAEYELEFPNPDLILMPGHSVKIRIADRKASQ